MASLLDMFGNISGAEYAQRFQDIENRRKREIMDREAQAQSMQTRQALGELSEIMGQVDLSSPEKVRQAYSDLIRIAGEENWSEDLRKEAFRMFNDMSIRQERARPVSDKNYNEPDRDIISVYTDAITEMILSNPQMGIEEARNLVRTGKIMGETGEIDLSVLGEKGIADIVSMAVRKAGLGEGAISQIFAMPEQVKPQEKQGLLNSFGRDERFAGGRKLGMSMFSGMRDFALAGMNNYNYPISKSPELVRRKYGYQPEDILGGGVSMPNFTVNEKRPTEQSEKGYNFQKREREVKEPMSIIRERDTGTRGNLRNNFKDRQEKDIEDLWRPSTRVNNFYMK